MRLKDCHNVADFRRLAESRLPSPIFNYIDGAADDERTKTRNTSAFDDCDLVPNVLAGVSEIDMGVTVMGQRIDMPLMLSPRRCSACFTGRASVPLRQSRSNIIYGLVSPHSPPSALRKSAQPSKRQKCSNSTSTRTRG